MYYCCYVRAICFAIAPLQCLQLLFSNLCVQSERSVGDIEDDTVQLFRALAVQAASGQRSDVRTLVATFVDSTKRQRFPPGGHQDSMEFVLLLIDKLNAVKWDPKYKGVSERVQLSGAFEVANASVSRVASKTAERTPLTDRATGVVVLVRLTFFRLFSSCPMTSWARK